MGVSEVLLCPYRCLEYKMERLEKPGISEILRNVRNAIVHCVVKDTATSDLGTL